MLCPICSKPIPTGATLCQDCGATLNRVEQKVREKENENKMEMASGSALCASIEGYIRLCELLPLPEVGAIVGEYLERLLPKIQAGGGQVNWHSGDKVVAYFGFYTLPDHYSPAERAVMTALSMHQAFAEFTAELLDSYARDVELELRIGIATGELLRGSLGDPALARPNVLQASNGKVEVQKRQRYRRIVIGDAVNLAMQLEYEARPGHILTDKPTQQLAQNLFEFTALGPRVLRRRARPVDVFSIAGPRVRSDAGLQPSPQPEPIPVS
jgi:class 3 adenylate cyclase